MKDSCIIPLGYQGELDKRITENLVQQCQNCFEQNLMEALNLQLISSPLFLEKKSGLNDDLSGSETAVSFSPGQHGMTNLEVVHSLAKWKRNYLSESQFEEGEGVVTRMNAIRKDEVLSNIHSYSVDQWDWEKVISKKNRTIEELRFTVKKIYQALWKTQNEIHGLIEGKHPVLPTDIRFIHSERLLHEYPNLSAKEREYKIVKKHKAVFLIGIGNKLSNGLPHDDRAPDYDDWSTVENGLPGLNGDILIWNPVLKEPIELSSMGIRVDAKSLMTQLEITDTKDRLELPFHQKVMNDEVVQSIGGGIGKSRLTLFLLEKAHIGEVQKSFWPTAIIEECTKNQIVLL